MNVRMKNMNGVLMNNKEVKEFWKRHFKHLMSERTVEEQVITSLGIYQAVCV